MVGTGAAVPPEVDGGDAPSFDEAHPASTATTSTATTPTSVLPWRVTIHPPMLDERAPA